MKKLIVILIALMLAGCASLNTDKYKGYRNMSAAQIYDSADLAIVKYKNKKAVTALEALDMLYPFGQYSRQARLDVIYAYYLAKDKASSIAAADRYIRLYPRGPYTDYAYYMKGLVSFQLDHSWLSRKFRIDTSTVDSGNKKAAFLAFNTLLTSYPRGVYAPDAALRMAYIRNMIARKNVDIAQFYMKRKAYIAAANRASFVVQHFEGSPEVVPALAVMVKAYRKMGLTNMENKTYAIMEASYPNSKEFRKLS